MAPAVYIGIFALLILYTQKERISKNKELFVILITAFLIFLSVFRATHLGDPSRYREAFYGMLETSYSSIIESGLNEEIKDPGYYIVGKFFGEIGFSADGWFVLIALAFAISFGIFLYRYSEEPMNGLLLMLTLFFSFTLTGFRQTCAFCFILFAYDCILKKKPIGFVLMVLLASQFHSTSLVFLPAYWISKVKFDWKQLLLVGVTLLIALTNGDLFRQLIEELAWTEQLEGYSNTKVALTWSGFIIQAFVWGFCLVGMVGLKDDISKETKYRINALMNCMTVGLMFQSFSAEVAEAFRLSYYYFICCTIAVPMIIMNQKDEKIRFLMHIGAGASLIAYMLYSRAYTGFWFIWQM